MSSNIREAIKLPKSTEDSHEKRISYDELFYFIVEKCVKERVSPERVIADLAMANFKDTSFSIYLGGSAFTAANNNSLDFLLSRIIKADFGNSENLIVGTAFHSATAYAFKTKKEKGYFPNFRSCFKQIIGSVEEGYKFIKPELRDSYSKKDLYKEAAKLFSVYHKTQMHKNSDVLMCEEFLAMPTPKNMFKFKHVVKGAEYMDSLKDGVLSRRLVLTGTPDLILQDSNGVVTIVDHKTSKKPIAGKIEVDPKLTNYQDELKTLEATLKKLNTQLDKFSHSEEKLKEVELELESHCLKLEDAILQKKATKRLEERKLKLESEVQKWEEHVANYYDNSEKIENIVSEIEEVKLLMNPYLEEYLEEKEKVDLIECRNAHANQLSFYALLFMILKGPSLKKLNGIKVRIENMVKSTTPFLQVFEWELNERELDRAEELYQSVITLLEIAMSGLVDPLVLFRRAEKSYIGTDTNKLIDEVNKRILEIEGGVSKSLVN